MMRSSCRSAFCWPSELVPGDVMADLRLKADLHMALPKSRAAAITVVVIWLAAAIAIGWWASTAMNPI